NTHILFLFCFFRTSTLFHKKLIYTSTSVFSSLLLNQEGSILTQNPNSSHISKTTNTTISHPGIPHHSSLNFKHTTGKMANPITNLPLPLPPDLLTILSNLTTSLTHTTTATALTDPSLSPEIERKAAIIRFSLSLGIPGLFFIFIFIAYLISRYLRKRKARKASNPHADNDDNTGTNSGTAGYDRGNILPLDARNMGILGRHITPEDDIDLGYGSWETVSSMIPEPDPDVSLNLEDGDPNSPPPYVERWEEVDLDCRGPVGDLRPPPPVYHPLI
ncbi:hypothetical protein DL98DRAFT_627268, partial [Cadophora sp. DSE1049]